MRRAAVNSGIVLFVAGAGLGCAAEPCSPTSLNDDVPSPAIECAAGKLCYQGSCIQSCNAGQERSERCNVDDDCPSARSICNQGFCSACEQEQRCVPTLNLCRPISLRPTPAPPPMPTVSNPKFPFDAGPLDGSAIDPGLLLEFDAGDVNQPVGQEVTHVVFVDVAQFENRLGAPVASSLVNVHAFRVAGNGVNLRWRGEFSPPLIECQDDDNNDDGCGARRSQASDECVIRPLRAVTASDGTVPTSLDLGGVRIDNSIDRPNSIRTPVEVSYQGASANYQVNQPVPLPDDLLVFSELPQNQHFILIAGDGFSGIFEPWPVGPNADRGHHVPFRLMPSLPTLQNNLERRPVVANPPLNNLLFQWTRIDSGTDTFEFVFVRITGNEHEMSCLAVEGRNGADSIEIAAGLLASFRTLEGPGDYPMDFERSNTVKLLVNSEQDALVESSVRVRHTFQSEITFE